MLFIKKSLTTGLVLCGLLLNAAYADNRWIVGGGGSLLSFDDGADIVDNGNLLLRLGYAIGDSIELGVDYSLTLFTDDINDVDHDIDIVFAFVKGRIPINDNSDLYLVAGVSRVKLTESIRNSSDDFEDDGSGLGFGVQVQRPDGHYFAEYLLYYDDDEFDDFNADVVTRGFNLGIIRYF